jgi:hypothetical protein
VPTVLVLSDEFASFPGHHAIRPTSRLRDVLDTLPIVTLQNRVRRRKSVAPTWSANSRSTTTSPLNLPLLPGPHPRGAETARERWLVGTRANMWVESPRLGRLSAMSSHGSNAPRALASWEVCLWICEVGVQRRGYRSPCPRSPSLISDLLWREIVSPSGGKHASQALDKR